LAGVKECASALVNKGAVGSIMRMTSVMKNDEVTRQCAVSLSNLASGSNETHTHIMEDGGIGALVDLASHGLVVDENEEESSLKKDAMEDDDEQDWNQEDDKGKNALTPMSTLLTRVAPRAQRKIESIDAIDHIVPVLEKGATKTMASDIDGIATTRASPPAPVLPTLSINTTENQEGEEDDENEDDETSLGAAQVLELVEKHLSKYTQLALTDEHLKTMDVLRKHEKNKQKVAIHELPKSTLPVSSMYVADQHRTTTDQRNEAVPEMHSPTSNSDGANAEDDAMARNTLLHDRSITGKYSVAEFDEKELSLGHRPGEDYGFPKKLQDQSTCSSSSTLATAAVHSIEAMFDDTDSFLGHLDSVLGKGNEVKRSSRPRKQLIGQWPFDEEKK